ncbi:hypothetical protein ABZ419_08060 [Streptomyces cinnamoneus]|uniref:hypothetical protein n=1 Tax=Streptomyces cinnamoneus TaxID=53446 RepID=UPI0033F41B4A
MYERIARLLGWTRARHTSIAPPPRPTPPPPPRPAVISLPHTGGTWAATDTELQTVNARGRWGK